MYDQRLVLILLVFLNPISGSVSSPDGKSIPPPSMSVRDAGSETHQPVGLVYQDKHVMLDNGILQLTLSNPEGSVTEIRYNGIENLLDEVGDESDRGYWDIVWTGPGITRKKGALDRLQGTEMKVVVETQEAVELSFTRTWNSSTGGNLPPLNIDKRYIMIRGSSGFYTYAIYDRPEGWPHFTLANTRLAIKLNKRWFHYMAMADTRQREMPLPDDRLPNRSQPLAYPEAVLLTDPIEQQFKGEYNIMHARYVTLRYVTLHEHAYVQVDDKYQYAGESKDIQVHGWICSDPPTGMWQITASNEFRSAGPTKQYLNSHVGPTSLSVLLSTHYSGRELMARFEDGEPWKKVLGPLFVHVNSRPKGDDPRLLWDDAKGQLKIEAESWPYNFPASEDFLKSDQRGSLRGTLLVYDKWCGKNISANGGYIGLAMPGEAGSWQRESKGYQFWTNTKEDGSFSIDNVRPGTYGLYAWIPGFIGDYRYGDTISITAGCNVSLGDLVYEPPRDGPTLWEIGIPDRSAAEFFVPDPDPKYINKLYLEQQRFRQYGLWDRYTELYPKEDLVYTVNVSDYRTDWFFAQVNRNINHTYNGTTWKINFNLDSRRSDGAYYLRLALASATRSILEVRINDPERNPPLFSTGQIGEDNTIARHGIRGLYWLYGVEIPGSMMVDGNNTIFLTQALGVSPWSGILYDYIRLERPY